METYSTDEERVEALKKWWKENGVSVIVGLTVGLLTIGGVRYWFDHQKSQAQSASLHYEELTNALSTKEYDKVNQQGDKLLSDYSGTPYATLAALAMAKAKAESGDLKTAQAHLRWVLDNAQQDGFEHVARQRLVRVLLASSQLDEASTLLQGVKGEGFTSVYEELRGDVYVAQSKNSQAREAYRLALASLGQDMQRKHLIEMKMDDLSVPVTATKAVPIKAVPIKTEDKGQ